MRKPFPLIRPRLSGHAPPDPAGGRELFHASDLILLFIAVFALLDIALRLLA